MIPSVKVKGEDQNFHLFVIQRVSPQLLIIDLSYDFAEFTNFNSTNEANKLEIESYKKTSTLIHWMCRRRRMKKLRLPLILLISLFWSISCWDLDKELLRQLTREQLKMEHEELTKMNWRMNQVKKMMPSSEEDAHE